MWTRPTLTKALALAALGGLLITAAHAAERGEEQVGRQRDGSVVLPTHQRITPAGAQVELPGRPNEVAVRPGGGMAAVLVADGRGLRVRTIDLAAGRLVGDSGPLGQDASYAGLAWAPDGRTVYASGADGSVFALPVDQGGVLGRARAIAIPTGTSGPNLGQNPYPGGLAVSDDGGTLYVALSRDNALGIVDVASGAVTKVAVGNAPHSVVVADGKAYVSNEGGRPATPTDTTNTSAGTQIVSDPFGGGSVTGTVSVVDLAAHREVRTIPVGLHPTALLLDGAQLYVANTHGDSVSVIDTVEASAPVRVIPIQPFTGAPYGSTPTGLAMLPGHRLAVTLGLVNALAVFSLDAAGVPALEGLVPTAWYPSDVDVDAAANQVVVANLHGVGTTADADAGRPARGLSEIGSVSVLPVQPPGAVAAATNAVRRNNGWDEIDTTCASPTAPARAIPLHSGEPSLIKHVIYVIKENRTYDQLLGDIGRGNGDPSLAQFGRRVTPNTHALATQFPLMDNFYNSGRRSNDGHNWAVQGAAPDYLEKGVATKRTTIFGPGRGTPPSSGFDALLYQPSGFVWENALRHGRTFENYGEYTVEDMPPPAMSDVPSLEAHTVPEFSGFELTTPDVDRARIFTEHLAGYESKGTMPDLITLTLPNDHTGGSNPQYPTPETQVADNDEGLGRIVDAVSHSSFWSSTAIFVEEDDTQGGPDHVEGHRGPLLVISPYAKHGGYVDSRLYTQVDVLRTIELILGLPPMNIETAAGHPLRTAFTDTPDLRPYDALVPDVLSHGPVMNPPLASLTGIRRLWAQAAMRQDLTHLDAANEALLNHDVWYATHRWAVPYPGESAVLAPDLVQAMSGSTDDDATTATAARRVAVGAHPALVVPPPPAAAPCTPGPGRSTDRR